MEDVVNPDQPPRSNSSCSGTEAAVPGESTRQTLVKALESFEAQAVVHRQELKAEYGSVKKAIQVLLETLPEARQRTLDVPQVFHRKMKALTAVYVQRAAAGLGNVDAWRALAEKDPGLFRSQLDAHLKAYKSLLREVCDQPSHRAKSNEVRDRAIWEIKTSNPAWSFGKVVHEYKRVTGKAISANVAERAYKRAKRQYDSWLDPARMVRALKAIQKVHESLKPSVAKSRAT